LLSRLRQAKTAKERARVETILGALGDPQTFSALLAVISDVQEDLSVRTAAVDALGELDGDRAPGPLLALLASEPESILRAQAAYVLGELKQPEALITLLNALDDQEPIVRAIAARSLGNFYDPQIVPALRAMIAREIDQDDNFEDYLNGMGYFPHHLRFADHLPEEHAEFAIGRHELANSVDALDGRVIIFRNDSTGLQPSSAN
ncbi:MAG TPA: HEAT repeat domain-containing protein, partial [Ktedonobacteraceae bacterium]|nr:HEAT repeat domain-containing protein [Ktedonobacteraceae bacterium]